MSAVYDVQRLNVCPLVSSAYLALRLFDSLAWCRKSKVPPSFDGRARLVMAPSTLLCVLNLKILVLDCRWLIVLVATLTQYSV